MGIRHFYPQYLTFSHSLSPSTISPISPWILLYSSFHPFDSFLHSWTAHWRPLERRVFRIHFHLLHGHSSDYFGPNLFIEDHFIVGFFVSPAIIFQSTNTSLYTSLKIFLLFIYEDDTKFKRFHWLRERERENGLDLVWVLVIHFLSPLFLLGQRNRWFILGENIIFLCSTRLCILFCICMYIDFEEIRDGLYVAIFKMGNLTSYIWCN